MTGRVAYGLMLLVMAIIVMLGASHPKGTGVLPGAGVHLPIVRERYGNDLVINIGNEHVPCQCLLDTGCSLTSIDGDILSELPEDERPMDLHLHTATGWDGSSQIVRSVFLNHLDIGPYHWEDKRVDILPAGTQSLLGTDLMNQLRPWVLTDDEIIVLTEPVKGTSSK